MSGVPDAEWIEAFAHDAAIEVLRDRYGISDNTRILAREIGTNARKRYEEFQEHQDKDTPVWITDRKASS